MEQEPSHFKEIFQERKLNKDLSKADSWLYGDSSLSSYKE